MRTSPSEALRGRADAACLSLRATVAAAPESATLIEARPLLTDTPEAVIPTTSRPISAAEVIAVQKQVEDMSDSSIASFLAVSGFSEVEAAAMMRALKQSQERTKYIYQNGYGKNSKAAWDTGAGKLAVPQWEKDMQDAEMVVAQAEAKQVSSDRLRLEASISAAEAAELGPALKEIDDKILQLQMEADMWGWLPFSEAPDALEAAKGEWQKTNKDKRELEQAAAAALDAAEQAAASARADLQAAAQQRAAAVKAEQAAADTAAKIYLAGAEALVSEAEMVLVAKGKLAALQVLAKGTAEVSPKVFAKLNLKPDARASPGSLAGRLYALTSAPKPAGAARGSWGTAPVPGGPSPLDGLLKWLSGK